MKCFFHKIGCSSKLELFYLKDFETDKHYSLIDSYMTINRLNQIIPKIEHLVINASKWWVIYYTNAKHCNLYVDSCHLFPDVLGIFKSGMQFKSVTLYSYKPIDKNHLFLFQLLTKKLIISNYHFYSDEYIY